MSRVKLRKLADAQACKLGKLTTVELGDIHDAARAVASEIVYDLVASYKNQRVPRYAMIECVIDASRLEDQLKRRQYVPQEQREVLIKKIRDMDSSLLYSIVGMELGPGEVYCV